MPESSYRPPAIQASSSGSTGHQGQTLGQQITSPRGYFECGDLGHMRRFYPTIWGKAVQQGQQPMISAPAVRPPRGGRQAGRGYPRGGGQAGGGQSAIVQSCGGQPARMLRYYLIQDLPIHVSYPFAHFLDVPRESLGTPVYVSTLVGNSVVMDWIYRSCVVTFCVYETRVDLLLLDMIDFKVILGMDWLSPYHAILECHAKTITLAMSELPRLEWKGSPVSIASRVISFLKARHMIEKGCLAYLAYVRDTTAESSTIDSVLVVWEFAYVFPSDLPGMPPDHDIDFRIDLAPGTQPISIPPYRMAPKELKELKKQLEKLLAKGVSCEVYTDHRILQRLFKQRDVNLR
ncbi:uncharacterized protein [Nicotiana tomentosiformis]|uniref:uncharacterized protein n=1 Tax=Nicotiana tomentosiformis TaxID=4098 RepID=UPI00388CD060